MSPLVAALLLTLGPAGASDPAWEALPSITTKAWNGDLRVAPDGSLLVCFRHGTALVGRLGEAGWERVGGPASCGQSWQSNLIFDQNETAYVVSRDYDAPGSLNVHRRVADGPWEPINVAGTCPSYASTFFEDAHNPVALARGASGPSFLRGKEALIVLFLDGPGGDQRPTAIHREDGGWKLLGSQRFSAADTASVSLVDCAGETWAAYWEDHLGGRLVLTRYDPILEDWFTEASTLLRGESTVLARAYGKHLVLTNKLGGSGGELRSYRAAGSKLVPVGGVIAVNVDLGQQSWIQQLSTAKDSKGRLYVAYRFDDAQGIEGRIGVSRLVRNAVGKLVWESYTVSDPAVQDVRFLTMDIDAEADIVYVGHTQADPLDGMDFYRIPITD